MARMVGYVCDKCGTKDEELFTSDTEVKPETLDRKCICGGNLVKNDRKDNNHRWNYLDREGF